MQSDYRCFFCFTRSFEKLLTKENISTEAKNNFTHDMALLYAQSSTDFSAPLYSRKLRESFKKYTHNSDPYKEEKRLSNEMVLNMYSDLRQQILNSEYPFDTALRLAIAGNIIDFGVDSNFDLPLTINKVLQSNFAIDNSLELKKDLENFKTVLYLGDNSGEIVFDKLFIETIMHPNIHYAVRGNYVQNDVTLEDAKLVGMDEVANVISNGYDAPSTILEYCSSEFLEVFNSADVIISKGQGNLEGLLNKTNKNIYFLLMVKCDVIAESLHVNKGDFIVLKNTEII